MTGTCTAPVCQSPTCSSGSGYPAACGTTNNPVDTSGALSGSGGTQCCNGLGSSVPISCTYGSFTCTSGKRYQW
jgi:hypothetical protein